MQNSNVSLWSLWVVRTMGPCVHSGCCRMTVQVEHFNVSFPDGLTLECLFDWHRFDVLPLLTESQCQTIQALHVKARARIQPFDMGRANHIQSWVAHNNVFLNFRDFRLAVAMLRLD